MRVYLESSAALRDLLEGDAAQEIRAVLRDAELVTASRLTLAEVARVMARLHVEQPTRAGKVAARFAQFETDSERWAVVPIDDAVLSRCGRPFPREPVRTLDAIHLASIERLSGTVEHLVVVSTDERVRENAVALGFELAP